LLNMVNLLSHDTGVSYAAAKRVLWILCREWELEFKGMIQEKLNDRTIPASEHEDLKTYLQGLVWIDGGNERWGETTARYQGYDI